MCGIAGVVSSRLSPGDRVDAVQRMCNAMAHRGPDDSGIESDGPATLGMRRLAIFDPRNGHQPMVTADRRYWLVFNGAIYNFKALRTELEGRGHMFRTECDTEVLLASFAEWGRGCLGRLEGMFAFAVWDSRKQELFVGRDELGIKPLYYVAKGDTFAFGSELKALLAGGVASSSIDPAALSDHLAWLSVPPPRTIYREIRALEPGCFLRFSRGELTVTRYWALPRESGQDRYADRREFLGALAGQLDRTVAAHTVADVPVGAFLSGGLDSAVTVALMRGRVTGMLKTFSITFPESDFSEAAQAKETADFIGTEHSAWELTGSTLASDLPKILAAMDHPTGDGINTYYASEVARRFGVTVAVSGLGGDEMFGGYPSFTDLPKLASLLRWWRMLPGFARRPFAGVVGRGSTRRKKLSDFLQHSTDLDHLASLQRRVLSADSTREVLRATEDPQAPFHPMLETLRQELAGADPRRKISGWELRTYMADVLLADSDMMSMRQSLELRVPFVHRPLVEWLWRQPANLLFPAGRPKGALYDCMKDRLPPGLMERKKRGFTLPFAVWMKRELKPFIEDTFSEVALNRSGLFSAAPIRAQWASFLQGSDDRAWSRLWNLAVLVHFVNSRPTS